MVLSGFKTKSRSQDTGKHDFPSTSLKTGSQTCSQDRQCQDQNRKWQYETKCTQFTQKLLSKTSKTLMSSLQLSIAFSKHVSLMRALWGRMKMPQWLKILSTGAEGQIHGRS